MFIKKNMGTADRIIRILLAGLVGVLYLNGVISGILTIVLLVAAVVFIVTSFVSFCPLYLPFKISTFKKK